MKKLLKFAILVAVAAFLAGCVTVYEGKRCYELQEPLICPENSDNPDQCIQPDPVLVCSEFAVRSRRQFKEGIEVEYNSTTGDLKITAGSVETDDSVIEKIGLKVIEAGIEKITGEKNE
jgi:hypothetical protein